MRRMRAPWVLGAPLVLSALALSCGSGGADGLFTQPSSDGGGGASNAGASSHAGATHVGAGAGGASNPSGGAEPGSEAGAPHGGSTGKAGAGGGMTSGAGGGGAGGSQAGAGGSHAGGAGAPAGGAGAGAGAGAGGAMAGAGGGAGATCLDNGACAESEYCAKTSCAPKSEGHCTPSPSDCGGTKLAVVCGCDGVTYHDACLLHQARQNSSALDSGACLKASETTVTCTEVDAQKCTGLNGVCGFKAENACIAVGPAAMGICWVLPASCPGSDDKTAQVCSADNTGCTSECDAIKNGQRYALAAQCN